MISLRKRRGLKGGEILTDVCVTFLWHFHQPAYSSLLQKVGTAPWPRLHALREYRDMAWMAAKFPQIKQCFNCVPCLLDQVLLWKDQKNFRDAFFRLAEIPAGDLNETQVKLLLRTFFMGNWDTMVRCHPRYAELLALRGTHVSEKELDEASRQLKVQDLRDLQVWHNLAWVGYSLRAERPWIEELVGKGRGFSEEEKRALLHLHMEHVTEFISMLSSLVESGTVELTTSPYYHPVLPLLCHMTEACRPHPRLSLPRQPCRYPEDAAIQLRQARQRHEELFHDTPLGVWPPEAAISEESIEIIASEGFEWLATDEEILVRSMASGSDLEGKYWPQRFETPAGSVSIVSRDKRLSDFIALEAFTMPPSQAVNEIMKGIERVRLERTQQGTPPLVAIILEGEHAWAHYEDSGQSLLERLLGTLCGAQGVESCTVREYLHKYPSSHSLRRIYPGSWVQHGFAPWVGEEDECLAWEYLAKAKAALGSVETGGPAEGIDISAAREALFAAEGSDWFLWFGDDFNSDHDEMFDVLFRAHLVQVYESIGLPVPTDLSLPISSRKRCLPARPARGRMKPVLDGRESDDLEWAQASLFILAMEGGILREGDSIAERLFCGSDMEQLWIRLDFVFGEAMKTALRNLAVLFTFIRPRETQVTVPMSLSGEKIPHALALRSAEGEWTETSRAYVSLGEVLELGVSFADLGIKQGEEVRFIVEIVDQDGDVLERWPRQHFFAVRTPVEDHEGRLVKV